MKNYFIDISFNEEEHIIGLYEDSVGYTSYDYNTNNINKLLSMMKGNNVIGFNISKFELPHIYLYKSKFGECHKITNILKTNSKITALIRSNKKVMEIYNQPYFFKDFRIINIINICESIAMNDGKLTPTKRNFNFITSLFLNKTIKNNGDLKRYSQDKINAIREIYSKEHIAKVIDDKIKLTKEKKINLMSGSLSSLIIPMLRNNHNVNMDPINLPNLKEIDDIFYKHDQLKKYIASFEEILESKTNDGRLIVLDNLKCNIGFGGLHGVSDKYTNTTKNGCFLNIDITSFYPEIYNTFKGIISEELQLILSGLLNDRKYPDSEKELNSYIYRFNKTFLNSIYGKLKSKTSVGIYNKSGGDKVAITGQLILIYSILKLQEAGYGVFYANTDGLIIDLNNLDSTKAIELFKTSIREFLPNAEVTSFEIEKIFIRNVNSYLAKKKNGKIFGKGNSYDFSKTKSYADAIVKSIRRELKFEDREISLSDYSFIKTTKNISEIYTSIGYMSKKHNSFKHIDSIEKIIEDDVDYEWYKREYSKYTITQKVVNKDENITLISKISNIDNVFLFPKKGKKHSYKNTRVELKDTNSFQHNTKWINNPPHEKVKCWSIICSPITKTLCLDVDYPEKFINTQIHKIVDRSNTLRCTNKENNHLKYFFRVPERLLNNIDTNALMEHGVEINYGQNKESMIIRDNLDVIIKDLKDLPEEIQDLIYIESTRFNSLEKITVSISKSLLKEINHKFGIKLEEKPNASGEYIGICPNSPGQGRQLWVITNKIKNKVVVKVHCHEYKCKHDQHRKDKLLAIQKFISDNISPPENSVDNIPVDPYEWLSELTNEGINLCKTAICDIERMEKTKNTNVCVVPKSGIFTISALTGHGKTALLIFFAKLLLKKGERIAFVATEESKVDIMERFITSDCDSKEKADRLINNLNGIARDDFYENDYYKTTTCNIKNLNLKILEEFDIDQIKKSMEQGYTILIDYAQNIASNDSSKQRYLEIKEVMNKLKTYSKRYNSLILMSSQLSSEIKCMDDMFDSKTSEGRDIYKISDKAWGIWNSSKSKNHGKNFDSRKEKMSHSRLNTVVKNFSKTKEWSLLIVSETKNKKERKAAEHSLGNFILFEIHIHTGMVREIVCK